MKIGRSKRALGVSLALAALGALVGGLIAPGAAAAVTAPDGIVVTAPSGVSVVGSSITAAGALPAGWTAPDGLLSYTLVFDQGQVPVGSSVTVTISGLDIIPQALISADKDGHLTDLTPQMTVPAGQTQAPYTIELTLTDGGLGDEDGVANGQIVDPIVPAVPSPGLQVTSTGVSVSGSTVADQPVTWTATIGPPTGTSCPGGSVQFTDELFQGSPVFTTVGPLPLDPGTCSVSTTVNTLGAGFHVVTAVYTPPNNCTGSPFCGFTASLGSVPYILTAPPTACDQDGSQCTDVQNVNATVPVGTLVINTPYTAASPLNLGTLELNSTGTEFTSQVPFDDISVTDTRSGVGGANTYTVSALATALTDGGTNPGSTINAENVGLTGVTSTPGIGFHGTVTTGAGNPAADPAVGPTDTGHQGLGGPSPHTVFTATGSTGTVTASGTLTLDAPTSTEAGLFTGTITFTVG
jgi:hypothetical protein